jgi:hypothetical protein
MPLSRTSHFDRTIHALLYIGRSVELLTDTPFLRFQPFARRRFSAAIPLHFTTEVLAFVVRKWHWLCRSPLCIYGRHTGRFACCSHKIALLLSPRCHSFKNAFSARVRAHQHAALVWNTYELPKYRHWVLLPDLFLLSTGIFYIDALWAWVSSVSLKFHFTYRNLLMIFYVALDIHILPFTAISANTLPHHRPPVSQSHFIAPSAFLHYLLFRHAFID